MNFFEAQDKARRSTFWLVLLFTLAVIALVALTNLVLLFAYRFSRIGDIALSPEGTVEVYSLENFAIASAGVIALILGGSLYKMLSLAGGGTTIAELLGGRLVSHSTTDPLHRRLLNVVEEMAIAAGMPIPLVYVMSDQSINAFAAGRTPADAVIGITDGALRRLSREELQGVIAHEFSHIANGDMRLNIRLISILHGILLIGLIGYFMLRSTSRSSRFSSSGGGGGSAAFYLLGVGLMIIGYVGTFFGKWIKAIVSRQREYLADSSAVQFTRSIDGIGGALKKIGAASVGSYLASPFAPQYSHAYIAEGIDSFWQPWFATHPPLEERIRRIEPGWDGEFLKSEVQQFAEPEPEPQPAQNIPGAAVAAAVLTSVEQAISEVGTLNEENIDYVHELIIAMPLLLREAARDAYSARALIYAGLVVIQRDEDAAIESLSATVVDPEMQALVEKYTPELQQLDDRFKLPLLELCVHSLREMSPNQYVQFKRAVTNIIASDRKVNLREWVVQRFVIQQLDLHFGFRKAPRAKHGSLAAVRADVEILLSLIAQAEHRDRDEAGEAFAAGAAHTGLDKLELIMPLTFGLERLDAALDELTRLKPLAKPRLLKACVAIVMHDDRPTSRGIELVRAISTCIDCPMPPLRAG